VVGPLQIAVCPRCGGKLIVPYDEGLPPLPEGEAVLGICATCLQTSTVTSSKRDVQPGDRGFADLGQTDSPVAHHRRRERHLLPDLTLATLSVSTPGPLSPQELPPTLKDGVIRSEILPGVGLTPHLPICYEHAAAG
jgi:hypothetical protein